MNKQVEPVEPVEPDTWPKTLAEVSALFGGKTGTELYSDVAAALRYMGNPSWVTRCAAVVLECNPPAQTPHDHGPQAETVAEAAHDVGKWLNERPSRPLDLRHVAMLVAHAQTPPPETTPIKEVIAQWDADLAQGQMAPEQAADFVRREREFAAAQTPVEKS